MEKPDVVVGTPSRVLAHLNAKNLVLHSSLEMLVVDEADLLFSFGFEADLKNLLWWVSSWSPAVTRGWIWTRLRVLDVSLDNMGLFDQIRVFLFFAGNYMKEFLWSCSCNFRQKQYTSNLLYVWLNENLIILYNVKQSQNVCLFPPVSHFYSSV